MTPATTYLFKAFLNVAAITTGYVGFYVDEYNAAGAWISGQTYKDGEREVGGIDELRLHADLRHCGLGEPAGHCERHRHHRLRGQRADAGTGIHSACGLAVCGRGYGPHLLQADSWLAEKKISQAGAENGATFRPAEQSNRDQMAAFLYRMSGTTDAQFTPPAVSPFADVSTDHTFYRQIAWLADKGISAVD